MKDDHIACLPYVCLLGKNSLPARKQCIVVGRNVATVARPKKRQKGIIYV